MEIANNVICLEFLRLFANFIKKVSLDGKLPPVKKYKHERSAGGGKSSVRVLGRWLQESGVRKCSIEGGGGCFSKKTLKNGQKEEVYPPRLFGDAKIEG